MSIDYGFVTITRGRNKGKTGYYDDDTPHGAIVYLTSSLDGNYVVVRHTSMRRATKKEFGRFAAKNPYWER